MVLYDLTKDITGTFSLLDGNDAGDESVSKISVPHK